MAKKINDIIKASAEYILNEQSQSERDVRATLLKNPKKNPYVGPFNKDTKYLPAGGPWKGSIKKPLPFLTVGFFNAIGAKPYKASENPYAKETTPVYVFQYAKETFWLNPDGTVNSIDDGRRLFWQYSPNQYTDQQGNILSKPNTGQLQIFKNSSKSELSLTIYIEKNGQPNIAYPKTFAQMTADEKARQNKIYIRKWMDVVGFVPIIGDAVDAYQALWYWSDYAETRDLEDLFMGCLSAIAVIPIVGSVVKISGRAIVKTVLTSKGASATFMHVLGELIRRGGRDKTLSPNQVNEISKFLKSFAEKFSSWNKTSDWRDIAEKMGMDTVKLDTVFQTVATQFRNASSYADDIFNVAKKNAKKVTNIGSDSLNPGWMTKQLEKLSSLTYDRSADVAANWLVKLTKGNKIIKSSAAVTSYLTAAVRYSIKPQKAKALRDSIKSSFIESFAEKWSKSSHARIASLLNSAPPDQIKDLIDILRTRGGLGPLTDGSFNGVVQWLDDMPTENWRGIAEDFTKKVIEIDHPVWLYYLSDPIKAISALHLPNNLGEFSQLLKANLLDVRKWLDIIVNTAHDAMHDAGIEFADEDKQSVIYQGVKDAWRGGYGYKNAKDLTKGTVDLFKTWVPNTNTPDKAFQVKGSPADSLYTPQNITPKLEPKKKKNITPTPKSKKKITKSNSMSAEDYF